ncbi:hypothetical protein HYU14_02540 [Candidatus Woesearchaeota archaeon]|nr:hypothetical protein [Candidatus Woesearchaeota archaeon]
MIVIVDANILISALVGSRRVLALLLSEKYSFYTPGKIAREVRKYRLEICRKAGYSEEIFEGYFNFLFLFVKLVDEFSYVACMQKAISILGMRDIKDADYLASALSLSAAFIWTDDKDFTAQHLVKVKTTAQFIAEHKAKSENNGNDNSAS